MQDLQNLYNTISLECMVRICSSFKGGMDILNIEFDQKGCEECAATPAREKSLFLFFFFYLRLYQRTQFKKAAEKTSPGRLVLNLKHAICTSSYCWSTLSDGLFGAQLDLHIYLMRMMKENLACSQFKEQSWKPNLNWIFIVWLTWTGI